MLNITIMKIVALNRKIKYVVHLNFKAVDFKNLTINWQVRSGIIIRLVD